MSVTTTLSGRLTDANTGEPLPFATVFVNLTTRGTLTDELGYYRLPGVPLGTVELVASYVGYEASRQTLRFVNQQPRMVNIALKRSGIGLQTVTVVAKHSRDWQRHFRIFKAQLLGNSLFVGQCTFVNGNQVQFSETNGHLQAKSTEPLVVENNALGYRIHYQLQYFDYFRGKVLYAGNSRFEEMQPADPQQAKRWQRNRQRAYLGSTRHLLASLINGTYRAQGFDVYETDFPPSMLASGLPVISTAFHRLHKKADTLFRPGELSFERRFVTDKVLEIFYIHRPATNPANPAMPFARSLLTLPKGEALVTLDGWITKPQGMLLHGDLGNDRLANLLPADWQYQPTDSVITPVPVEGTILAADPLLDSLTNGWKKQYAHRAPTSFLHIDKSVYVTGDALWVSAFWLNAATHQLIPTKYTDLDDALHVDLIAPGGRLVEHQWVRLKDGRGHTRFALADTLPSGTYQLRAYPEEERNHPNTFSRPAFERTLTIFNPKAAPKPATVGTAINAPIDLQFLPEGGQWVAGLPARLGIKAVGPDGKGRAISGHILNAQGQAVTSFTTNRFGMGSVELTPLLQQTYVAVVAADSNRIALPPAKAEGLVLYADMTSDSSRLTVRLRGAGAYSQQPVYVLVQSRGVLAHYAKMQLQDGKALFSVPVSALQAGLCQLTVLDSRARPWAERLVFVPETTPSVQVNIIPGKTSYKPRERATFTLHVREDNLPVVGFLSASITDADQVTADTMAADIRAHLLLTGDLRGRVEEPGYYFRNQRPDTRRALDDLLLTQGWRRLSWQDQPAQLTQTDTLGGVVVSGRVIDRRSQPVPNSQVLITTQSNGQLFTRSIKTDAQGRFRLGGLMLPDTARLHVQASDESLRPIRATVQLDNPGLAQLPVTDTLEVDWASLRKVLEAGLSRQRAWPELYRQADARLLNEVVVKANRENSRPPEIQRSSIVKPDVSLVFDEAVRSRYTNVYEMMQGRVAGVRVRPKDLSGGYDVQIGGPGNLTSKPSPPLYLIDGVALGENEEGTALLRLLPREVERIEVVKYGNGAAYGARGGNGIIAIYTRKGGEAKPVLTDKEENRFTVRGFAVQREFYTPGYESSEFPTGKDQRDVLYWKPVLQTNSQGQADLAFSLSEIIHKIRINIQGISIEGKPISIETTINCEIKND
ncbi:hypothetical protein GCM10023187_53060 [Nibrella viscosa]|uniref:TonB-dependent receptor plug domain-containing protein n=2 Tax=Nibrella viscosa TaxID=1084524 RepID=A0ABP8KYJ7_9BACT